jgi:DNA-binding MarR family transcriptional regulator
VPKPSASSPSLGYIVARLDRVVRREVETVIAPHGLTVTQYLVLSVLDRQPGLSSAQLARRAYVSPQSMNETLLTLEQRNLVTRQPDPARRRVLNTQLSKSGQTLVKACNREVSKVESTMTAGLTDKQSEALRTFMVQAVRNLGGGFPDREAVKKTSK